MRTDNKYSPDFENKKMQLELEKQRYAASRATPKFGDRSGEGFQRMADRTQDKDIYGRAMFQGLADGFRVSADRERSKEDEAFMKRLKPLQEWVDATHTAIEQGREQKAYDQKLINMYDAYSSRLKEPLESMEYDQQKGFYNNMFADVNTEHGTNHQLIEVLSKGKGALYYDSVKGSMDYFNVDKKRFEIDPEGEKHRLKTKETELAEDRLQQNKEIHDPKNIANEETARVAARKQQEDLPKLENKLFGLEEMKHGGMKAKSIVEKHPDILTSPTFRQLVLNTNPGVLEGTMQNWAKKLDTEKATAIVVLNKLMNDFVVNRVEVMAQSGGNVRLGQFMEGLIQGSVPNWASTPDGFKEVIDHILGGADRTINHTKKLINRYQKNLPANLQPEGEAQPQDNQQQDPFAAFGGREIRE